MLRLLEKVRRTLSKYPIYKKCGHIYWQSRIYYDNNIRTLNYQIRFWKALIRNRFRAKTILTYPELPSGISVLYKIAHASGYWITNKLNRIPDVVVYYHDMTFGSRDDDTLRELKRKYHIINYNCRDISKRRVDLVFEKIFGYSISVNPLIDEGECVKKSNINAEHDGVIIRCPIDKIEEDYVYQKVVNNRTEDGLAMDIRTPIYGTRIPLVYFYYRDISNRFGRRKIKIRMAEVNEAFSQEEVEKILMFCREMGLDFGELDILRDKDDGRLYIVDANNTPSGLATVISKEEKEVALKRLSAAFEEVFIKT